MGCNEGENGSFIAIIMKIHQNFSFFHDGGYAQISDSYVHIWYICYCYCIAGHSLGTLMYLKTRKLNFDNTSVVFFSCFKKFKCLGDVLDSVTPITVCNIDVL